MRNLNSIWYMCLIIMALAIMSACSSTRHIPQGKMLLDKVKIDILDNEEISELTLFNYLRQQPNHEVLGFAKIQLGLYNLSGRDSSKWYNQWARRLGQEPVIYDKNLAEASKNQIRQTLINRGYSHAEVTIDSIINKDSTKINLKYIVKTGSPLIVENISYDLDSVSPTLRDLILSDSLDFLIRPGSKLSLDDLEMERVNITNRMRDRGYYSFNKNNISFIADTVAGSNNVDLTLVVKRAYAADTLNRFQQNYFISKVTFYTDGNNPDLPDWAMDSVKYKNISVVYGPDHYLKPSILDEKCFIKAGQPYSASDVTKSYEALAQLGILKYINIVMKPVGRIGDIELLDADIYLSRTKKQSVTLEVEGTNSEGDLGFGLGLVYQHRNISNASNLLTGRFRVAYESLSGNLEGLINNRYTEYAGEVGIRFPKFEAPFLSKNFKQRVLASTEFALSMNYQERPEYTRIIAGAAWKYRWENRLKTQRHTLDLIDINLVNLPRSTLNFIDSIAPSNPLLRYSYEDHFIMRIGYSFYKTNHRNTIAGSLNPVTFQPNIWTVRASVETAGNLLYAISNIIGQHKSNGAYKIFGVQYAQYVKGDIDYAFLHNFDNRFGVAFHAGFGLGVPYGNSSMIPFEKRFYAGGANSVRGWGVRTLGPGRYDAKNSVTDFINQCGDIRLDLSVEFRSKLFWVLEGALFVDAGNIWTIRNYVNQPGGLFRFNSFYKELAAAYGVGLRFDFTYFLLRLDLGLKAHNPAMNQEEWPLLHPRWHRDATFHFSIGYPF